MLKMFSFGTNTCTQTFASLPVINCVIDHALLQATSDIEHVGLAYAIQFIGVMNFRLLEPLLHLSPSSVGQPGSDLDCWRNGRGCFPFQNADW